VVGVLMVYNNLSSTKQMRSKQTNDLTFIEVAIVGTTVAMCASMVNGNSILPSKQKTLFSHPNNSVSTVVANGLKASNMVE